MCHMQVKQLLLQFSAWTCGLLSTPSTLVSGRVSRRAFLTSRKFPPSADFSFLGSSRAWFTWFIKGKQDTKWIHVHLPSTFTIPQSKLQGWPQGQEIVSEDLCWLFSSVLTSCVISCYIKTPWCPTGASLPAGRWEGPSAQSHESAGSVYVSMAQHWNSTGEKICQWEGFPWYWKGGRNNRKRRGKKINKRQIVNRNTH